ncbi:MULTISPECIES: hypothetical protein [Caballeronia]|uniref:hypothetical protein n=1 Tax=Caballeronia TaxID=1827195 RepID=UPI001EF6BE96|nr:MULTISPECIES: hypothetical protein [Caballeronia]MCG7400478.1 hypothetical protein [Caballeronia zhejiangensis]
MKASWLLQAVLQHAKAQGSAFAAIEGPGRAMRGLESALFMIGYDLDAPDDGAEARLSAVPTPPRAAQRRQEDIRCPFGENAWDMKCPIACLGLQPCLYS